MYQERLSREADFYRKITPFLSFEIHGTASGDPPVIDVYADGGGYAFNVLANIVQTNASTGGGGTLVGQNVIRYLRDGPPKLISFMPRAAEGFAGEMRVTFIDTLCRVGTEVAVAKLPKVCRTAAEGVLSPRCRTYTPELEPPTGIEPVTCCLQNSCSAN